MSYLSAKKIYPGNWAEPLNSWYKNIDNTQDGTNESSKGGPTSVLAIPGYRYFQAVVMSLLPLPLAVVPLLLAALSFLPLIGRMTPAPTSPAW
jgi:hypothetical protein